MFYVHVIFHVLKAFSIWIWTQVSISFLTNLERPKPRPSFSHFGSRNHIFFFSCHSLCFFLYLLHFSHFLSFSSFTLSLSTSPNTITIIATFHHQPPLTPPISSSDTAFIDDNTLVSHISLILFLSLYHHIDSIGVVVVGSLLHPCTISLLSPFFIFVSSFLSFFFISYPFSHPHPHHSTSTPSLVPSPTMISSATIILPIFMFLSLFLWPSLMVLVYI